MARRIVDTADGTQSIFDEELNETYHSIHGATSESEYVYIKQGLERVREKVQPIRVLEVGFGTGLNAWLTYQWSKVHGKAVHYTTLEPHPLEKEEYKRLHAISDPNFLFMHDCTWDTWHTMETFRLRKYKETIEDFQPSDPYDVIYYDAFAPSKQPDIWALSNLTKCFNCLEAPGIWTTYSAQGQLKRNIQSAGFLLEVVPGALRKKEMVVGLKR